MSVLRPRSNPLPRFLLLAALAFALGQGQVYCQQAARDPRALVSSASAKLFVEDWYGAIEDYRAALELNPSYAEALSGLAEGYYELGEYDEALTFAKRASPFMKGDADIKNLEGFIRIGLGDLKGAQSLFAAVVVDRPNDLDARFGLALLDLAGGKKTEAKTRLEDSLKLSPQNARALLSLALIAADQGRKEDAASLIERALRFHGQEPRVQYMAARLAMEGGDLDRAVFHARNAIQASPSYVEARRLLGSLLYQKASYAEAISLMQEGVARNRKDPAAWYTLGLAQTAAGRNSEALYSLKQATSLKEDDEIARLALEDLVMDTSPVESPSRTPLADWHFDRGEALEERSFFDQALLEYRRGLTLSPDSKRGRILYAGLLLKRKLPGKYLSELKFLAETGQADLAVKDAIETYDSLLADRVGESWGIDQYSLPKRPYRLALFLVAGVDDAAHTSSAPLILRYLKDLLASSSRIRVLNLVPLVSSASEAFKKAREAEADYYLILDVRETERDVLLGGELRVARTAGLAAGFSSFRTGNDKVKEATNKMAGYIEASMQPKGSIIKRKQNIVLVDLGSEDGIKIGDKLGVLKIGSLQASPEGLGASYPLDAVIGEFTVSAVDEEICEGVVKSTGFFDTINSGDEIIALPPPAPAPSAKAGSGASKTPPASIAAAPAESSSLFALVRRLR